MATKVVGNTKKRKMKDYHRRRYPLIVPLLSEIDQGN